MFKSQQILQLLTTVYFNLTQGHWFHCLFVSVHVLSVCEDGKRQVCEEGVLPVLLNLLQDEDVEVRANAAGVVMYTVIITAGTNTLKFPDCQ